MDGWAEMATNGCRCDFELGRSLFEIREALNDPTKDFRSLLSLSCCKDSADSLRKVHILKNL